MSEELQGLPNITKVVDDNIVYSANELTTYANFVRKFLTRCRERGIRLQRDKFVSAKSEITFDGIVLSDRGSKIQDKVLNPIKDFKKPETLTDLQSFQEMANQLAPFNRDLATALQPLRPLLRKTADPFNTTKEKTLAFQKAKDILIAIT